MTISLNTPNPYGETIAAMVDRYLQDGGHIQSLDCVDRTHVVDGFISPGQINHANEVKAKRNRRMYRGELKTRKELEAISGRTWATIRGRLAKGMTLEEAMHGELRGRNK